MWVETKLEAAVAAATEAAADTASAGLTSHQMRSPTRRLDGDAQRPVVAGGGADVGGSIRRAPGAAVAAAAVPDSEGDQLQNPTPHQMPMTFLAAARPTTQPAAGQTAAV